MLFVEGSSGCGVQADSGRLEAGETADKVHCLDSNI